MLRSAVCAILILIGPVPLSAAESSDCDSGNFIEKMSEAKLARVSIDGKAAFLANPSAKRPSCPSADKSCETKSYVVRGDELLVLPPAGDYVCATYKSPSGKETAGWLPKGSVATIDAPATDIDRWAGLWRAHEEAKIKLAPKPGGRLEVSGDATYGALDPGRVRRGAVNIGELTGVYAPKNGILGVGENYDGSGPPRDGADNGCEARLRLLGRYLIADDNLQCGGMNVSFKGIYVRAGKEHSAQ
jgi:hypothetical protein